MNLFSGRCLKKFKLHPSMYEIGRYFLQHKFVVKRNRKRGR